MPTVKRDSPACRVAQALLARRSLASLLRPKVYYGILMEA
jgi:hypothetical protein